MFFLDTLVFHPLSLIRRGGFGCFSLLCLFFIHFLCFDQTDLDVFPCYARFSSTFFASTERIWTFSLATFVFHPLSLLRRSGFGCFSLLCSFFIHFICFDGAIWTFFLLHSQLSAKQNNSHNNQHRSHCRIQRRNLPEKHKSQNRCEHRL